ncbi:MAG: alpha/beta hydrolase [Actinobacteria bacterium]|nr:alpha/beta hydrolase [Actinomycetota bacterium]
MNSHTPALSARAIVAITLSVLTAAIILIWSASPANAANPYERGPAPTLSSIQATTGPFATATTTVPSGNGFGGGTIYYPTDTSQGTFAAIAMSPGFFNTQSAISWYGKRIASQGFVFLTINTNTILDFPDSRATQLLAALDYLTQSSPVSSLIDSSRLGVMGYSMGGGGTLKASKTRPSLEAAVGVAPWHSTKNWSTNTVPSMMLGMQNDTVAPASSHAIPFYNSLPASIHKVYAEVRGASHSTPTSANTPIAQYSIAFLKQELDNDTRYTQFLCPAPAVGGTNPLSAYSSTCPF